MGSYDLKRLEVAIQYIRRMAEGRNPVTNKPAPQNDVLTNVNVNRCLKFVEEILSDVHSAGGQVGAPPRKSSAPKPSLSETFPYEILTEFQYEQDQQISYLLNQIGRPLPEDQKMPVAATLVTTWLRENGYLEKRMMEDIGKENSVPTEKGRELGLYSEKAGMGQNMYYRVYYNENAQRFIVDHFRQILREYEDIRARTKKSRKQAAADSKEGTKASDTPPSSVDAAADKAENAGGFRRDSRDRESRDGNTESGRSGKSVEPDRRASGNSSGRRSNVENGPATGRPSGRRSNVENGPATGRPSGRQNSVEDDPAFASLLSNISDGDVYGGNVYGPEKDGFSKFDFMGEGWEYSDEDIPW
ncbi:MAG: hypothetical protein Q4C16_07250 [Eubacteriales bacterium]|nr:hypothetical protein [Eubacteriales bacterium]